MIYRGARAMMEGGAGVATEQKRADLIAAKAQRVRKAAEKAQSAEEQLSTGVLERLDLGEMALLNRINGLLPNQNLATLEDATKLGDDVVLARAMAVQDAAAFNLWAQNAMIRSAAIQELAVDKLSAGTFTAGTISLGGSGRIGAGRTSFDSAGMTMGNHDAGNTGTIPGDLSIKNPQGTTNFWPWLTSTSAGWSMRADPLGSRRAAIFIGAFYNASALIANSRSASIELYGGTAPDNGNLGSRIDLNSPVRMRDGWLANSYVAGQTLSSNSSGTINHGQGTNELLVYVQAAVGSGQWRDISFINNLFVEWVTDTQVKITNATSSDYFVRTFIYKLAR